MKTKTNKKSLKYKYVIGMEYKKGGIEAIGFVRLEDMTGFAMGLLQNKHIEAFQVYEFAAAKKLGLTALVNSVCTGHAEHKKTKKGK